MDTAFLARIFVALETGQPKGYLGSDMAKEDIKQLQDFIDLLLQHYKK